MAYRPRDSITGAERLMTDRIAFFLGLVLFVMIGLDFGLNGGDAVMFLARKLLALVDWMIFWH